MCKLSDLMDVHLAATPTHRNVHQTITSPVNRDNHQTHAPTLTKHAHDMIWLLCEAPMCLRRKRNVIHAHRVSEACVLYGWLTRTIMLAVLHSTLAHFTPDAIDLDNGNGGRGLDGGVD